MAIINIKGLDKAELLAEFYNASQPMGMGFLQARSGVMTREDALKIMEAGDDSSRMFPGMRGPRLYFDYVYGRPLKIDLSRDEMETRLFDRDNGEGRGERCIEAVRARSAG